MVFWRSLILVLMLAVLSSTAVMADSGIPWVGWITPANLNEASIWILPDGSGPPLTEALNFGGQTDDASIVVGLIDNNGDPIANFPWEDIWLEPGTATAMSCYGYENYGFPADHNTDANGETIFANPLAGGGWTEDPIWVYLNGSPATDPGGWVFPPVPLRFNSPDINADGEVNLTDLAFFSGDFFGTYHYRSDFWWDGVLNLSDLAQMALGYGTSCE